jgi:hypothetical protein
MIDLVILRITQSPSALGTIVLLLIVFLPAAIFKPQRRVKAPFLDGSPTEPGQSKPKPAATLLREGYERVRHHYQQKMRHTDNGLFTVQNRTVSVKWTLGGPRCHFAATVFGRNNVLLGRPSELQGIYHRR